MEAKNIEQYFGTLQQSTVEAWRKHLKVSKKSQHETLNDFYEDIVEVVDKLIEDYMSIHGKVENYENLLSEKDMDALKYLETLREFTREGADELFDEDDTELFSDVDNILSVMDTAIYKLKELEESKSFKSLAEFINESLTCNNPKLFRKLGAMYNDYGDLSPVADCFHWLDDLNWKVMKPIQYAKYINDINDSVEVDYALEYYAPIMLEMAKAGRKDTINAISFVTDKKEMKDFDINEGLVNENYKPTSTTKDWEKVLKKLSDNAQYSNYSQLCDIENILKDYTDAFEWLTSVEDEYKVKLDKGDNIILQDIVSFYQENYEYQLMHYMDQEEEIEECKEETPLSDNKAVNYGVECEDYYEYYTYIGSSSNKKYAQLIAKYGDCSEDYSGY